ncbi:MAG: DUF4012 domain-containing protein, partial [Eggerthellaceae bacterium]|nr:DUF4012 domain-containing protein [Eggerthellaceae bacterium]
MKTAAIVLAVILLTVSAFAYSQYKAVLGTVGILKADAAQVMDSLSSLQDQAAAKDFEAARSTTRDLRAIAAHMQGILDTEEFRFAERIPKYGSDVTNARLLLTTLGELCDEAVMPLLQSLIDNPLSGLYSKETGINVPAMYALLDTLDPTIPLVQEKLDKLSALPEFTIPQLRDMMKPAFEKIGWVDGLLQSYSTLFADLRSIAHAFLGDDGNKVYMIVAQCSAEMRSSGGFPGAIGLLRVVDGKPSVGGFGSVHDLFPEYVTADYGVTDVEMAISRDKMALTRSAGYQPDYCRAAQIWARAYTVQNGVSVDGVISLTPSMVQRVLAYTGPITLSDGTELNGSNATKVLQ